MEKNDYYEAPSQVLINPPSQSSYPRRQRATQLLDHVGVENNEDTGGPRASQDRLER